MYQYRIGRTLTSLEGRVLVLLTPEKLATP